jgi:uncharacterized protein YbjT (DUF2867 family)
MKYVITGSLGHISKPVVSALVKAGKEVVVITSNNARVKEIESLGAKAAVGSVEDVPFLTNAFKGAAAVYTMVPPKFDVTDWKEHIGQIGRNYATAIRANQVTYVVNLSSIGAHMQDGCGPVSGLFRAEHALNELEGTNIIHLRPAYFYYNLFNNIGMIKNMGIIGSNFGISGKKFPVVEPADIAEVIIDHLLNLSFKGQVVQYLASDEVSTDEIANAIGQSIGKPDLKWVTFTDDQALQGALQAGLPKELASNYTEMGHAINSGEMNSDYWKHHPEKLQKTKLADFANSFAAAFNAN